MTRTLNNSEIRKMFSADEVFNNFFGSSLKGAENALAQKKTPVKSSAAAYGEIKAAADEAGRDLFGEFWPNK